MDDETEFINELEEEMRRREQADSNAPMDLPIQDKADLPVEEDQIQEQYDQALPPDIPDNLLEQLKDSTLEEELQPDVQGSGTQAGNATVEEAEQDVEAQQPTQEELNDLVQKVTELGADDEVLGKDRMLEAIRSGEQAEARGGSYVEGFVTAVERMMPNHLETEQNAYSIPNVEAAPARTAQDLARERYLEHKEQYDSRMETVAPWPRDTIDAYHRMAMTYNAHIAGEKIDGIDVSKVDVFLSGVRFYQSNIFETAIIRALRLAGDVIKEHYSEKVEVEQNAVDQESVQEKLLKDDLGGYDYGNATDVSVEDIRIARQNIKEYGIDYGIDTTKGTDYNSTDNVKIFRATDIAGRVDGGDGKTLTIPGMRMVEVNGNRALVGPDGKVAHENTRFNGDTGLSQEDILRIEGRCNAFETRSMRAQIAEMAESRGTTVEELQKMYTTRAKEAYASRIEKSMLPEAERLESQTIPESREELQSFRQDLSRLERIEMSLSRSEMEIPENMMPSDLSSLKAELQTGIEQLESRITAMESRVELLRDTQAQIRGATIEDRFQRAATAEEQAVGRAGRIEYISNDTDKKILDVIDKGTEYVVSDVEKYNAAHPDAKVSYDADSGELYNHFGISESGKYDDRYAFSDLPADTPEAVQDYISQHHQADFEEYRNFDTSVSDKVEAVDDGPDTSLSHDDAAADSKQDAAVPEQPADNTTGLEEKADVEVDTATEPNVEKPVDKEENIAEESSDVDRLQLPTSTEKQEEAELKLAAAHEEELTEPEKKPDTTEDMPDTGTADNSADPAAHDGEESTEPSYLDKISDLLDSYFSDTDQLVSLEEDVINPIIDIMAEAGQSNYKDVFDMASNMLSQHADIMEQIDKRYIDLFESLAEASSIPADAIDDIGVSMIDAGISPEITEGVLQDVGAVDLPEATSDFEIPTEGIPVTIGGQDLVVGEDGIHNAFSGESVGGFLSDEKADQYWQDTDKALYDNGANVDIPDIRIDMETKDVTAENLYNDLEKIGKPDDVDFLPGEDVAIPESLTEIPAGIEGVEAAEGAAAAEGAVEAGAAIAAL